MGRYDLIDEKENESLSDEPYQLGLYEKAMPEVGWKEKLNIAKEAGYDFVELSIDASEEKIGRVYSGKAERRELRLLSDFMELPVGTLNVSALTKYSLGNPDPELRKRGMDIASRAIGLAYDLGARIVMIPGYDIYFGSSTTETRKLFSENIHVLAEKAAVSGVQLGFETMENEFMNTVEKAMHYVSEVNSNYLQIYPDIGNITNAAVACGKNVLTDLASGRGHLVGMHLKETRPGHFREIPYGMGHVDFEAAVSTAWNLGIRRYVTEFWYKENGERPKEVCRRFRKLFVSISKMNRKKTEMPTEFSDDSMNI